MTTELQCRAWRRAGHITDIVALAAIGLGAVGGLAGTALLRDASDTGSRTHAIQGPVKAQAVPVRLEKTRSVTPKTYVWFLGEQSMRMETDALYVDLRGDQATLRYVWNGSSFEKVTGPYKATNPVIPRIWLPGNR